MILRCNLVDALWAAMWVGKRECVWVSVGLTWSLVVAFECSLFLDPRSCYG